MDDRTKWLIAEVNRLEAENERLQELVKQLKGGFANGCKG